MPAERLSLAQQIAQLEAAAPIDYDPEDLQSRGAAVDEEMVVDESATREHYMEVGPSALRNRLPSVADAKYEGVRTSRKQLLEDTDDSVNEDSDEGQAEVTNNSSGNEESDDDEREPIVGRISATRLPDDEAPSESEEEESEEERSAPRRRLPSTDASREQPAEDVALNLKQTRADDVKKGQSVKRQIALWDSLLDTRIRLQKSVVSANRLPPPSQIKDYLERPECRDSLSAFLTEAYLLTDELMELQENILTTNNLPKPPPRKRRKLDTDSSSEISHQSFIDATEDATALEQTLHPYLIQTLSKWSSKIQAVAPSVLLPSTRGSLLKGNQSLRSVVQIIDETLSDHDKLLTRTQISRGKTARIGASEGDNLEADTPDPEIFDDGDFYQKMLRDIIDARGDGGKTEDWMLLQRQKKAKKKVDTKASKGRKLRYEVHEKMQNFMVPVPVPGAWHDEQVDELFASLFGKGFENIGIADPQPGMVPVELAGFRVFG